MGDSVERGPDARLGVVAIVVEDLDMSDRVNSVLHEHAPIIVGRMGIPYKDRGISVISVIVDGTVDRISAMTGKLGAIKGVSVKAAYAKASGASRTEVGG
ncbi:MAG: iron-only hydrogenase system regulator [Thermanaerothrix sp.]|nr:iron-only hydrogenase system regulator [Thermanaerothrix sp.]